MQPSPPATEPTPEVRTLWTWPKVITVLLVLLAAYWFDSNWTDIKSGVRDGWNDIRSR